MSRNKVRMYVSYRLVIDSLQPQYRNNLNCIQVVLLHNINTALVNRKLYSDVLSDFIAKTIIYIFKIPKLLLIFLYKTRIFCLQTCLHIDKRLFKHKLRTFLYIVLFVTLSPDSAFLVIAERNV